MGILTRAAALGGPLRVPAFRRLWLAQLVSELGDWAARLALSYLVYERTGSAALAGIVTAASLIPWLGPGQLLTVLSERWPRRRVLVASDLVRAGTFALASLPVPIPVLIAIVFVAGLATPPFEAARSALRPEIVPPRLFGPAVALSSMTEDLTVALGYLAGGGLLAMVGAEKALLCNAASFALSGLLLVGLPRSAAARRSGQDGGLRQAGRELRRDPVVIRAITLVTVAMLGAAALTAMSAPLVLDVLHAGPLTLGALVALTSLVSVVLTALLPTEHPPEYLLRLAAGLTLLGGAGMVLGFTLVSVLPPWRTQVVPVAYAAAGLLFVVLAPANIVVGPRLRGPVRASSFSLLMGLLTATEAAGAAGAGLAVAAFGLLPVGLALGLPALLVGGWAWRFPVAWQSPGWQSSAPPETPEIPEFPEAPEPETPERGVRDVAERSSGSVPS